MRLILLIMMVVIQLMMLMVLVVVLVMLVVIELISSRDRRRRRRRRMVVVRAVHVVRRGRRRQTARSGGRDGRGLMRRNRLGQTAAAARRGYLVAQDPADARHAGHIEFVAHAVGKQPVADFPREHARVLALQPADVRHHSRRGDPRLAAAYGARQDAARFVVPGENFGHAAVRNAQLSANVTRPNAHAGQFDDAHAHRVRQRPTVDEYPAQLVHLAVLLLLLL